MQSFLQRFGNLVLGVLNGFDRLVFRGKLCALYSPEGMNIYLDANKILRKDFEKHTKEITAQVLQASLIEKAKAAGQFEYLASSNTKKDEVAREYARRLGIREGLVCVLQCVEPCQSFQLVSKNQRLSVEGTRRKCSHLYHYYLDPQLGWMYVRLQTWFPFEMQVYVNGREWLAKRMDAEGFAYRRSDNKILWVEDWEQAQAFLDEQLQTNWPALLDGFQQLVHPLHPTFLGKLSTLGYNWTTHQSEWASDMAFASPEELAKWMPLWQRQAMNYDSSEVLRFMGRSGRVLGHGAVEVETEWKRLQEGLRVKHWANANSLKLYNHLNIARVETTINNVEFFKTFRASQADPEGAKSWRPMRRTVADLHRRAEVSQDVNERYVESMASVQETRTLQELASPLCERAEEPATKGTREKAKAAGRQRARKVRALNPWAKEDGELLRAIGDPKWMVSGIRNRDLVAALYGSVAKDEKEKRRRSARVTRLIRILRGHGVLHKVQKSHRYLVSEKGIATLTALQAAANADPAKLCGQAA